MTPTDLSDAAKVAQYRAELKAVGRNQRLGGFGLVILGALAVWAAESAGAAGPMVHSVGLAALALGWALMLAAIFLRTRYHRQRMRETN